ncbi:hypothetical protein B9G69_014740 [Bdellovibrio sp. SKB1291214]|uniref:hypothetical protein n=1 Tax=Bdellovibrio sp. SKB1291214 TaxID=1732569 RepID=UPI000B518FA3|nr:hypothetical protein [Bdellovibrio sp. SKB1291214]UYL08297.1 hypothetical protein B9G69_014740 [Bdellovibrio sp. SKB1291214]
MDKITNDIWIGKRPPIPGMQFDTTVYSADDLFRASASYHRTFDNVYFLEEDLGSFKQWPLILDECLRLLNYSSSSITIRFFESPFLTVFHLKKFVLCWFDSKVEILSENISTDGCFVIKFQSKLSVESVDKRWSFGLLSDGSKTINAIQLYESIGRAKGDSDFEFIVCGPEITELLGKPNVKFVDIGHKFADRAWDTKKKNAVVDNASNENICIVTNCYLIDDNFFSGFEEFGYDFSILSVRQKMKDSDKRFPDWVTLGSNWAWTQVGVMDFRDYSQYAFCNGGLTIGKRKIFKKFPWNELLFSGQADDVEISRRMQEHSVITRINIKSSVSVIESRSDYVTIPLKYSQWQEVVPLDYSLQSKLMVGRSHKKFGVRPIGVFDRVRKGLDRRIYVLIKPVYDRFKLSLWPRVRPVLMKHFPKILEKVFVVKMRFSERKKF